jgi:Ca2+/Na+ antiporter
MGPAEEQKEAKDAIDVLSLEYTALRSEIEHHSAARNSMLSVALGVFVLSAALVEITGQVSIRVALVVMVLYLAAVGIVWFRLGRSIGQVSNHLVELERRINDLTGVPDPLLTWETRAQQRRSLYHRLFIGKPLDAERHSAG